MKLHTRIAIVVAILILALPLVGCVPESQYRTLQDKNTNLQIELEMTQSNLANLQADYNGLEAEKEVMAQELTKIKEIYPPRDFKDKFELSKWREETGIVGSGLGWVDSCLKLQEIGLADGYAISIDVDIYEGIPGLGVSLTVIAGEYFYQIYPDELEIYLVALVY